MPRGPLMVRRVVVGVRITEGGYSTNSAPI